MVRKIHLYNTKSRNIEEFEPIKEGEVGIYSCGPTVYNYVHLGNWRAFIFADTLHRMFLSASYKVHHVMNITDVGHLVSDGDLGEDKLEKGAKREGKTAWEVAKFYTNAFFDDAKLLNISINEYSYPRATDNIKEQIDLIKTLEEKGYIYKITDGMYFDTSKFKNYADFAHLDIEGLKSGARVEENKEKRNITDFALWKFSPVDEKRDMEWESPWGKGFPGWHIECSAMSKKILGEHFDIHTGGIDHIPVHHTNEIAQSECASGETFVNYWMHNNFLNDLTGKMSKSKGDFLRVQTLLDKDISPLAFRYYLLTTHYRKEIAFSFEALEASTVAYKKLCEWCISNKKDEGKVNEKYINLFYESIYNDLGTPECIAHIWNMLKDDSVSIEDKFLTLITISQILGLELENTKQEIVDVPENVKELLEERLKARTDKDWAESDRIRNEIEKLGFLIKDGEDGQEITKK